VDESIRLALHNELSELATIRGPVEEFLSHHSVSPSASYSVDLAIQEILTNIIKYAYPEGGHHEIKVSLAIEGAQVVVEFEDDGIAFDPSSFDEQAPDGDLSERRVGRLGLPLVREFVDDLSYRRDGEHNRLVVRVGTS
jgi:anti-sigma regulatory factor (Ser/Thr protein kinase)